MITVLMIFFVMIMDLLIAFYSIPTLIRAARNYSITAENASNRERASEMFQVATSFRRPFIPPTVIAGQMKK